MRNDCNYCSGNINSLTGLKKLSTALKTNFTKKIMGETLKKKLWPLMQYYADSCSVASLINATGSAPEHSVFFSHIIHLAFAIFFIVIFIIIAVVIIILIMIAVIIFRIVITSSCAWSCFHVAVCTTKVWSRANPWDLRSGKIPKWGKNRI